MAFDVFTIDSWDGSGTDGPDYFRFYADGQSLLNATFSTGRSKQQTYSPTTPLGNGGLFTGTTGNVGLYALAYKFSAGALAGQRVPVVRYRPTFTFSHSSGDMVLLFQGATNQPGQTMMDSKFPDEPFALDNVVVSTVPEPDCTTTALFALVGVWAYCRKAILRRKKGAEQSSGFVTSTTASPPSGS